MTQEIIKILGSSTIISAIGTSTVISMALSVFLYNGYYSKIWRAGAVLGGFSLSFLILLSGIKEADISLMTTALFITFLCSLFGFWLGVFIYRREQCRAKDRHGMSCHLEYARKIDKLVKNGGI